MKKKKPNKKTKLYIYIEKKKKRKLKLALSSHLVLYGLLMGQLLDIIALKKEEEEWENNPKIVLGNYPILFFDIWEENVRWSPNIVPQNIGKTWKLVLGNHLTFFSLKLPINK